jgi:hypothetical protein
MSSSPNKFVRAAASVAGGRGGASTVSGLINNVPSNMGALLGAFGKNNYENYKSKSRRQQRRLERDKAKKLQEAGISRNQKMFTDLTRSQYMASGEVPGSVASVEEPIIAPETRANNAIDNTVADAQDRSQMRAEGALTSTEAPVGFSTMSSAVLDPISRQPMGGVQPVPNVQEQTIPEDVATYGVAGAAQSMFGTPMQRQMSMGSSLMKRACKYKNKK